MSLDTIDLLADIFYLWLCILCFCFFLLELEADFFSRSLLFLSLLSRYLLFLPHIPLFDKGVELRVGEGFCQLVCNHLWCWNVLEIDSLSSYFIANLVLLDVNVFFLSVIERIVGKGDGSLIVTFERDRGLCWSLDEGLCRIIDTT